MVASTAGLGAATDPQAVGHAVTMVYLFCWVPFGLAAVFMFRLSALPCDASAFFCGLRRRPSAVFVIEQISVGGSIRQTAPVTRLRYPRVDQLGKTQLPRRTGAARSGHLLGSGISRAAL